MKHDYEHWVGDEEDGCHVYIDEMGEGFSVEVVVDSETGHFVDTIATFTSPTYEAAKREGFSCAGDWCSANGVSP